MSTKYFKGIINFRITANDEWQVMQENNVTAINRVAALRISTIDELIDTVEREERDINPKFVESAIEFAEDAFGVTLFDEDVENLLRRVPLRKLVHFGVRYDEMQDATDNRIDKICFTRRVGKRGTRYTQCGIEIKDYSVPTTANGSLRAAKTFDTLGLMGLIKPLIERELKDTWLNDYTGHVDAVLLYSGSVNVHASKASE